MLISRWLVILCGIGLTVTACGGTKSTASTRATTSIEDGGSATGICGAPTASAKCEELTFDDLPDAFGGWPEIKTAYRLGKRYDVYTSLGTTAYAEAVNLCGSVYSDLIATQPRPVIVVWSAGDSATKHALATGAEPGVGCTELH